MHPIQARIRPEPSRLRLAWPSLDLSSRTKGNGDRLCGMYGVQYSTVYSVCVHDMSVLSHVICGSGAAWFGAWLVGLAQLGHTLAESCQSLAARFASWSEISESVNKWPASRELSAAWFASYYT